MVGGDSEAPPTWHCAYACPLSLIYCFCSVSGGYSTRQVPGQAVEGQPAVAEARPQRPNCQRYDTPSHVWCCACMSHSAAIQSLHIWSRRACIKEYVLANICVHPLKLHVAVRMHAGISQTCSAADTQAASNLGIFSLVRTYDVTAKSM